jgi:hypothetical protein
MDDRAHALARVAELVGDRFSWLVELGTGVVGLGDVELDGDRGAACARGGFPPPPLLRLRWWGTCWLLGLSSAGRRPIRERLACVRRAMLPPQGLTRGSSAWPSRVSRRCAGARNQRAPLLATERPIFYPVASRLV